jgi:hypothetical protein
MITPGIICCPSNYLCRHPTQFVSLTPNAPAIGPSRPPGGLFYAPAAADAALAVDLPPVAAATWSGAKSTDLRAVTAPRWPPVPGTMKCTRHLAQIDNDPWPAYTYR